MSPPTPSKANEAPHPEGRTTEFPVLGLLPKQETQAWDFVNTFPEYDGRGVKVAIFDTGVDPAASGLQVCPDGRPKILNIMDCTGSGDVDVSHVVKASPVATDGCAPEVTGLSGRTLRLNTKWENPSGEWHLGIKRAYELFPKALVTRLKAERREGWDKEHMAAEAAVARELASWKTKYPNPSATDKKFLQDLEARAAFLEDCKSDYNDPGPLFDCVVWKGRSGGGVFKAGSGEGEEEETWWAAIDTAEEGDLTEAEAMTNFDKLRQHRRFGDMACLNFGIHIFDGGNVLSIVVDAGAHGTHVAGIVGAYYPDDPEANGVAPGVQIISLKIGDSRLGSMETGVGIVRAVAEAVRQGCNVINMSYGEPANLCNSGRMIEALREAVCKHRIVFVASAGNDGPALSTSGAPGGTTPDILAVGAYASPSLMSASFSIRENLEGGNFTWTSAGPTADGDRGVSVMAPGGAISPVPNWTLQKKQLMMGTSMASPNCAGVVCLLLSGMKQASPGTKTSPQRIRRALENTAKHLPRLEALVQGQGLVQVKAAFDNLMENAEDASEDIHYEVTVDGKRGVYLRQSEEISKKGQWAVTVKPLLHEDEHNDKRTEFEMRLRLTCKEDWVECSPNLELLHSGRTFVIAVDPTQLPPGAHHTCIEGHDVAALHKGPMFRVPITVLVPSRPEYRTTPKGGLSATLFEGGKGGGADFGPGKVIRRFVHPPLGAAWMDVEVKDCRDAANGIDGTRRLMLIHCVQLLPHLTYRECQCQKYLNMKPAQREVHSMRLAPAAAVEISLAQNWNAIGSTQAAVSVTFRGVMPSPHMISLDGGCSHRQVLVTSCLGMQELSPSAALNQWWQKVSPSKSTITALGERDVDPDGRHSYALLLEYSFKQTEPGEVSPTLCGLNGYLYDSAYEAQMSMVFDSNKKLIGVGDCWPDAVKCARGEHVVRVQVRHPEQSMLKRLKNLPLMIVRKLSKDVHVPAYDSMFNLSHSVKPLSTTTLDRGQSASYFFAEPALEKLPKAVKPGDVFVGTAYFVRNTGNSGGERRRPGGYPVRYVAGPGKALESQQDSASASTGNGVIAAGGNGMGNGSPTKATGEPKASRNEQEKMLDALRDLRVKHLEGSQARTADAFQELYVAARDQIRSDGRTDPDSYLPLLLARLHFLDREGVRRAARGETPPSSTALPAEAEGSAAPTETTDHAFGEDEKSTFPAEALDKEKEGPGNEGRGDSAPAPAPAPAVASASASAAPSVGVVSTGESGEDPAGDGEKSERDIALAGLRAVVAAADDVVAKIDCAEVARQLGMNVDSEDPSMVAARKDFDDKKKALVDALSRKARALAEVEHLLGESEMSKTSSPFLAAYSELLCWAEVTEDKYTRVTLAFLRRKGRLGMMIKLLTKLLSSSSKVMPKEDASTIRAQVFQELGWHHLVEMDKKWAVISHPKDFPLF